MNIELNIINSFSIEGTGGNPAGVVLDADHLTSLQKQQIAREARLSETAFVSKSAIADFKLEFFTPTRQIPHCGHATIATFSYLKSLNKIRSNNSSKETIDGTRRIHFVGDEAYMEQPGATFTSPPDVAEILKSIGLVEADLISNLPPVIGNTGNSFLLIGVDDEKKLSAINPDFDKIASITNALKCVGYYVFALSQNGFDAQTRMFAPGYGINEESATGMAAGPLACFLFSSGIVQRNSLVIGQGKFMTPASASRINVNLQIEQNKIKALTSGGNAYLASTRSIHF
jgi:PhzF family phenazine biosynthesis protein